MSDYDRQQWQAEQEARDVALDKQRERERKARERSARNAARKLERLHRTLKANDDLSEFEEDFAQSVTERLETYGSAFHDLEKGRPGDALSFAQKRVVSAMNRKVKDAKKAKRSDGENADAPKREWKRSSFKSKGKPKWTPRVRQMDEDFEEQTAIADIVASDPRVEPFIPRMTPPEKVIPANVPNDIPKNTPKDIPKPKRPFLRIVE